MVELRMPRSHEPAPRLFLAITPRMTAHWVRRIAIILTTKNLWLKQWSTAGGKVEIIGEMAVLWIWSSWKDSFFLLVSAQPGERRADDLSEVS